MEEITCREKTIKLSRAKERLWVKGEGGRAGHWSGVCLHLIVIVVDYGKVTYLTKGRFGEPSVLHWGVKVALASNAVAEGKNVSDLPNYFDHTTGYLINTFFLNYFALGKDSWFQQIFSLSCTVCCKVNQTPKFIMPTHLPSFFPRGSS